MANKVISIKMDEQDIEKIKKYYDALTKAGFLSSKTMSLNAFYKHLLLDYLDDDVCQAFAAFSECGLAKRCINPKTMNRDNGCRLCNSYNLSDDMYDVYTECVRERLETSMRQMHEYAAQFNEVVRSSIYVSEDSLAELECIPYTVSEENRNSFWQDKVFEVMESMTEYESKENTLSMIDDELLMIKESSVPAELKEQLMAEILQYKEQIKEQLLQKRSILQSGRLVR